MRACVCRHASSCWMAVGTFCCTNSDLLGVLPTNRLYSLWCRVPALLCNCSRQPGLVVSSKHSAASVAGWLTWMPHREALALWRFWVAAAWQTIGDTGSALTSCISNGESFPPFTGDLLILKHRKSKMWVGKIVTPTLGFSAVCFTLCFITK